jgi:uncharacterized protein involved in exopolysaccharide biosynthesis
MAGNDSKYDYDDEIELMDILLVIWRWKLLIIGFTALIVIITLVILPFQKDIYRVSMIIEPTVMEQDIDSKDHYVDTPQNIKALIDSNILNNRIVDKLGSKNIATNSLSFAVNINKITNQLAVSLDHSSPETAVDILKLLSVFLNEHYQSKIDSYIEKQKEKIVQLDLKLSGIKNIVESMESRIIVIRGKIKETESQYQTFLGQQKKLLSQLSGGTISDILQVFNRISILETRLDSYENLVYNLEMEKLREMNSVAFIMTQLDSNHLNEELIQHQPIKGTLTQAKNEAIRLINQPTASSQPVKPKKKRILSLAFLSGLLISLLSIFFLEYFKNYKNRGYEKSEINIQ